jgi:hypothetical protein
MKKSNGSLGLGDFYSGRFEVIKSSASVIREIPIQISERYRQESEIHLLREFRRQFNS